MTDPHFPGIEKKRFSGIADEGASSITDQLKLHHGFGWDSIELRTVNGVNVCEMNDRDFDIAARQIEEVGFRVAAFGSAIANWSRPVTGDFQLDIEDLRRSVPRMHRLDCPFIRIMSYTSGGLPEAEWAAHAIGRLKELTRIAAGEGIVLVHENCDGWASRTPANLARLLAEISDPALQIVFDPGNPLAHGHNPEAVWDFYRAAKERIVHFHIKDCYHDESGEVVHCYPGEGQCEVAALAADLEASGYHGLYSIEPHMTVQIHKSMDGNSEAMAETYSLYARKAMDLLGK
ncbi:MAG: sugar phosphate isomerase/epimerase family protein [Spirochaetota bacterium]|nr:sugar phosphate isomerase/epimerase family protein [Spirochaetota bacterium]